MDIFNNLIQSLEKLTIGEQTYIASILILLAFIVISTTFTEKLQNIIFMGCLSKILKSIIVFVSVIYISVTLLGTLLLDVLNIHHISKHFFNVLIITLIFTILVSFINIKMLKSHRKIKQDENDYYE